MNRKPILKRIERRLTSRLEKMPTGRLIELDWNVTFKYNVAKVIEAIKAGYRLTLPKESKFKTIAKRVLFFIEALVLIGGYFSMKKLSKLIPFLK